LLLEVQPSYARKGIIQGCKEAVERVLLEGGRGGRKAAGH